jgi:uncharacterized protein YciI
MTDSKTPLFFVCRLLAPRPTFMQDITAEERALMGAHAGYWREAMARGMVVIFGPVADPAGPWGLGVLRVADAQAVKDFAASDPVVKAGIGFRYEILPMVSAVLPG